MSHLNHSSLFTVHRLPAPRPLGLSPVLRGPTGRVAAAAADNQHIFAAPIVSDYWSGSTPVWQGDVLLSAVRCEAAAAEGADPSLTICVETTDAPGCRRGRVMFRVSVMMCRLYSEV